MADSNVQLESSMQRTIRVVGVLSWREIIRFLRQRNRVVGAVGQPIVFWILFGAGMHQSFQIPGQDFSQYFVPGIIVMILLFTAIFATISIIEDRNEGFLQSVLISPIPRWSMVLGKISGGVILAVLQSVLFIILALIFGLRLGIIEAVQLFAFLVVSAVSLTCLGFIIAWRLDSTQGFHAIMNLLLMPMWLLSGAFFPVPVASDQASIAGVILHWVMRVNPVTYSVAGVRRLVHADDMEPLQASFFIPSLPVSWLIVSGFAVAMFGLAILVSKQRIGGDLK